MRKMCSAMLVFIMSLGSCVSKPVETLEEMVGNIAAKEETSEPMEDKEETSEWEKYMQDGSVDMEDESAYTGDEHENASGTQWAVYWYMCGSDLESRGGCATTDLQEMLAVTVPDNVKIVIQTGGASAWQNNRMDASVLQRWVYENGNLNLVDQQPSASMGSPQTLADFLAFASANYPAERTATIFWNHGSGGGRGIAFDELYGGDSLTMDEIYAAFENVFTLSDENPPLELVGFDTCLTGSIDTVYCFNDIAHYMVGSEEVEPGNGWYYTGWLQALADNPSMDGAELGKIICDTFYEGCQAVGTETLTTLSVTDLSKTGPLLEAYEKFGVEMLTAAYEDPGFLSKFARVASASENYGGNTREGNYQNMVDLGDLARQAGLSSSRAVLNALNDCVLYQATGPYRSRATGLSCYYPYSYDAEDFSRYARVGAGNALKYYYDYCLRGEMSDEGVEYLKSLGIGAMPEIKDLTATGWDGITPELDEEGNAVLTLGPEAKNVLAGIDYRLYYLDGENDILMRLGSDDNMSFDWENGIFQENFRGKWGALNGEVVYMELSDQNEDYNIYSVPILLNEEDYNLQVVYDFTAKEWYILGARREIDENGMADKELRQLQAGDVITTLWPMAPLSGGEDMEMYTVSDITVTEDITFGEVPLSDGIYHLVFEFWDTMGNYAYADHVQFEMVDGMIYTTVMEK